MHDAPDPTPTSPCPNCGHPLGPTEETCPGCSTSFTLMEAETGPWTLSALPEMRYQNAYVWLILVSALDVMLTLLVVVLWPTGYEVNPVAAAVIEVMGFGWAIVFKFATIVLVVVLCEVIGRKSDRVGRRLSHFAVALNSIAVLYTFVLMFRSPIGN